MSYRPRKGFLLDKPVKRLTPKSVFVIGCEFRQAQEALARREQSTADVLLWRQSRRI